jgi:hypothetical protein
MIGSHMFGKTHMPKIALKAALHKLAEIHKVHEISNPLITINNYHMHAHFLVKFEDSVCNDTSLHPLNALIFK